MTKSKRGLVNVKELTYLELVKIVRTKGKKKETEINEAYNEIQYRIKPKIMYIVRQFYIPGCSTEDIYQEALYALRFKAILDYNKKKGKYGPYPFDNFAILCIRRHLSTLLKSSFQNKKKVLNTSISLDKNRNDDSVDVLFLSNILSETDGTISDLIENKEYYVDLFSKLFKKLSKFEKKVLILYTQKYSYEEITNIIKIDYRKNNIKKKINIKSVDNALSRIKMKGRQIFGKQK